eukprot:TRINITY_DN10936_c0_g1_i7.p2 TRINITY_DN10936_c0_g1~~TRINITY_DN10936_c0_g1_i7.p2  ORF type:complete len:145 (+),score=36.82 TRINITY_DN10936_c0_g1_i7:157-591(+)
MTDNRNKAGLGALKIHPEDSAQPSKSSSTSSSSLPALKNGAEQSRRRVFNLGIVRSGTMNSQGKRPELEYAQLLPQSDPRSMRKDRNGEHIDRKTRRHHITFRDEVTGGRVADVMEVPSYKKYNFSADEEVEQCSCKLLCHKQK